MGILPDKLFELSHHISNTTQELGNAGLRVEVGSDFIRYRALRNQQAERGSVYPMFDVGQSFVDSTNGFWICGFDENDDLVHTQAVRMLDLQGMSLATHLNLHRHKYITPNTTPDPDKTFFTGASAVNTITGRVAYQGDFWLRAKGLGGPRSQGATALLSRLLLRLTVEAWAPDYIFAFVPRALAAKGAHLRYGYTHCEPGRWIGPDQQVTDEDHLIWMSAADLAEVFQHLSPASTARQAVPNDQRSPAKIHAI